MKSTLIMAWGGVVEVPCTVLRVGQTQNGVGPNNGVNSNNGDNSNDGVEPSGGSLLYMFSSENVAILSRKRTDP